MAYCKISTSKDGKLRARIQVYGKDQTGKPKIYLKNVLNTENLTETKFRKQINRIMVEFETEVENYNQKSTNENDCITNQILTFNQLAEEWIAAVKANLSKNYYRRSKDVILRFSNYLTEKDLADKPISEISVRDAQLYFNSLSTTFYSRRETVKLRRNLPAIVNFRELEREKIINRFASYNMIHKDTLISLKTAQAICQFYKLDFRFYFDNFDNSKQYSIETIRGHRRVLRTIFNEAIRYEWITKNPICGTKISVNSDSSLKSVQEKEVFSFKEAQEFLRLLDELPYEYINKKISIKFMLLTGIRIGELCGLRWSDIDFEKHIVHIKRNRQHNPEFGTYEKLPKTKNSIRDIPLPDDLIKDLLEYKDWFRICDKDFDDKLDEYYINVNIYRQPIYPGVTGIWLKNFEKKHGLKEITCHGLRHTYCSLLLSQNIPIQTVSKYMGHSDSTVTLKVYTHFIPDTQEKVVYALNHLTNF